MRRGVAAVLAIMALAAGVAWHESRRVHRVAFDASLRFIPPHTAFTLLVDGRAVATTSPEVWTLAGQVDFHGRRVTAPAPPTQSSPVPPMPFEATATGWPATLQLPRIEGRASTPCGPRTVPLHPFELPDAAAVSAAASGGRRLRVILEQEDQTGSVTRVLVDNRGQPAAEVALGTERRSVPADLVSFVRFETPTCEAGRALSVNGRVLGTLPKPPPGSEAPCEFGSREEGLAKCPQVIACGEAAFGSPEQAACSRHVLVDVRGDRCYRLTERTYTTREQSFYGSPSAVSLRRKGLHGLPSPEVEYVFVEAPQSVAAYLGNTIQTALELLDEPCE